MQFAFTEEQSLIRDTARSFFDEHGVSAKVRAALSTRGGYDEDAWHLIAREMGWAGIAIAERYGGSGLSAVELSILQYEQGRRIFPSPFFASVCLGAALIEEVASEAQKRALLGAIASGNLRVSAAVTSPEGLAGPQGVAATLERGANGWRLSGECGFVVGAATAELLLILTRAPGSSGSTGMSVVALPVGRAGIAVEPLVTLDLTRPMATVRLADVAVADDEVLGVREAAGEGVARALQRARIALAAEAVGAAEWTLEMTLAYAKQRIQFGRAIGSFQAVKHRLADMMVQVEAGKSAAFYAACVAAERPQELAEAAAVAKASCCDAFVNCAGNAIQLHGGIGFTWEHDAHLYFKRARASATLLGSPSWQREALARELGLGPGTAPRF
jgi:alkylation response protein AidB-like acyl-CoA dehydrogenase